MHAGFGLGSGAEVVLTGSMIEELPAGLHVRFLSLDGTPIRELPAGLCVGILSACHTNLETLPGDIQVRNAELSGSQVNRLPGGLVIPGNLNLTDTPIRELPDDLTVGFCLDVARTGIREIPAGVRVGIIPPNDNVRGDGIPPEVFLKDGDFIRGKYIYADDILTPIKREKRIGDYTYYVGRFQNENVLTDGTYYAHCGNIRDGIRDLAFKRDRDRSMEQYRAVTMDAVLPVEEMVTMYRVITGACQLGTERFLQSLGELKKEYSVSEAIRLTAGQYGAEEFREFFA